MLIVRYHLSVFVVGKFKQKKIKETKQKIISLFLFIYRLIKTF